jgi:hypothetical protein
MIDKDTQEKNFQRLVLSAKHQKKVRRCEVEGMVTNVEKDFLTMCCYDLITASQLHKLEDILSKKP